MNFELDLFEARVIGCLIEKAITTPDQYPLSLNALKNACNQKSNRDPVLTVSEGEVQDTVDGLAKKHLVIEKSGFGSRVPKYQHRFCNSEFGSLEFDENELAIVCVLLLRGPQTPGELRARTNRLCGFGHVSEVERTLRGLAAREDGPFVAMLPREAGRRESRYAHLFGGAGSQPATETPGQMAVPAEVHIDDEVDERLQSDAQRLGDLEQVVKVLQKAIEDIRGELAEIRASGRGRTWN